MKPIGLISLPLNPTVLPAECQSAVEMEVRQVAPPLTLQALTVLWGPNEWNLASVVQRALILISRASLCCFFPAPLTAKVTSA